MVDLDTPAAGTGYRPAGRIQQGDAVYRDVPAALKKDRQIGSGPDLEHRLRPLLRCQKAFIRHRRDDTAARKKVAGGKIDFPVPGDADILLISRPQEGHH